VLALAEQPVVARRDRAEPAAVEGAVEVTIRTETNEVRMSSTLISCF
jgi:hypothetical protein